MKGREVSILMNSNSSSIAGQSAETPRPEWRQQLEAWRDLLAQCARKPSRRRVHALRALTLRIAVALEYGLREQAPEPAAERAFKCWEKEGKKLRRALRKVRDADVYLARLDGLRGAHGVAAEGEVELSPRSLAELEKLANRLKKRREAGIGKLMALLVARGKRLDRLSRKMEAAFAPRLPAKASSLAEAALKIFTELASDLPKLDSTNLHTFRKRLKPALYLAEGSAASDPVAGQLAAAFRKIHLAVGEWHDWQMLAEEAGRILPGHGKPGDASQDGSLPVQDGLLSVLERLKEGAFKRALGHCRRSTARFHGARFSAARSLAAGS
jgi:hypothetical protein